MGASWARVPSRKRMRPPLRPRLTRNASAASGVSCAGSTLTASAGTSWPRSSSAPRMVVAVTGQVSWQVEYMKVSTTTCPRSARSETVRPSWSRRVKSLGGIAGRRPPAKPLAPSLGGGSGRVRTITPAAARMAREAKTMSAMRRRAGIAASVDDRFPDPRPYGGRGGDRPAVHLAFRLVAHHLRPMRILVVDDEPAVREALERILRLEGFDVEMACDGREAVRSQAAAPADAVLLDVLMPQLDGLEVCRRMRDTGDRTPVLMLTARDEVGDRVAGLEAGADDYLPKPFALEELLARLRALLRRSGWMDQREVLRFDDLELDPHSHEVRRGQRLMELTRTEFLLLELFLHHPRQVLTRSQIFDRVWGYDFGPASNSLEVYVGYLRRKTEQAGEPRLLHTVRGVGYVLRAPRP